MVDKIPVSADEIQKHTYHLPVTIINRPSYWRAEARWGPTRSWRTEANEAHPQVVSPSPDTTLFAFA